MTPKERVYKTLEHQEPDRIPWGEHSIDYNVYEDILGRKTFVQAKFWETKAYWEGRRDEVVECYKRDRLELIRALEMDMVFVGRVPPKDFRPQPFEKIGETTYRDENGTVYHISSTTHDLMAYQVNLPPVEPPSVESLEEQLEEAEREEVISPDDSVWELVRHAVCEMGKTHFIMVMAGDIGFTSFGHTDEERFLNLALYPEQCALLTRIHGTRLLKELDIYRNLGVDGLMPCGDLGSSTALLASPKWYREHIWPWHKAYCDKAHSMGLKVLKHCCGHLMEIIDDLADAGYDAYEGIQHSGGMDLKVLKHRVGDRLTLWGGIWHEHIIMGSPEDIRTDARYAFRHAAPGGGFIMGSSHSLAVDAKRENILEMKRVRDEWGVYPIDPRRFDG